MHSDAEIMEYIQLLKLVVFAHRYNKCDEFLANPVISFDVVRDPMYRFSRTAESSYLVIPVLAFLLSWFAKSSTGQEFVAEKCKENSDPAFGPGLSSEVREMGKRAMDSLSKNCSLYMYISKL
jgi:hypothetical protein